MRLFVPLIMSYFSFLFGHCEVQIPFYPCTVCMYVYLFNKCMYVCMYVCIPCIYVSMYDINDLRLLNKVSTA